MRTSTASGVAGSVTGGVPSCPVTILPVDPQPSRNSYQRVEHVSEEQAQILESTKKTLTLSETVLVESAKEKNRISELKVGNLRSLHM